VYERRDFKTVRRRKNGRLVLGIFDDLKSCPIDLRHFQLEGILPFARFIRNVELVELHAAHSADGPHGLALMLFVLRECQHLAPRGQRLFLHVGLLIGLGQAHARGFVRGVFGDLLREDFHRFLGLSGRKKGIDACKVNRGRHPEGGQSQRERHQHKLVSKHRSAPAHA
jgi:hypothetical protein